MKETERDYLKGSILLSRHEDGSEATEYEILSTVGEGSSTVCYEAVRKEKDGSVKSGKLKEFYPAESMYYSLKRLPSGQLVPVQGAVKHFYDMCQDYINTYRMLTELMVKNPKNEILKNYIQDGEILYGCGEDDRKATVYIWSTGFVGKGFDGYLEEIQKKPANKPEEKLRNVLNMMIAVTDCIKTMHTAGLIHLDIKPSNFLLHYDSDYRIESNKLSLFDINTICSIDSKQMKLVGTPGYCAPEIQKGRADNRSDIYSIGAMLFRAIVVTDEIPDHVYRDFYYANINQLVRHSEFFQVSDINSDPSLMNHICHILEGCLHANPNQRFQSCSEVKTELEKAKKRLEKLLNMPKENGKTGSADPMVVVQNLLYKHPLYESLWETEKQLNVLVIGSGIYGQKFMDMCLQAGQMCGIDLHITAASDAPNRDKETYLKFRPALADFVNVDGSMQANIEKVYAELNFEEIGGDSEEQGIHFTSNVKSNQELLQKYVIQAMHQNRKYHYIFIDLDGRSDEVNMAAARACSESIQLCQEGYYPVCYISRKTKKGAPADLKNKLYPVCINEAIEADGIDSQLKEMAFNTHISWKQSMNLDMTKERKNFFESEETVDRYNLVSSLAFALSIKYKLHSVGIDCEDRLEAARYFAKEILEGQKQEKEKRRLFDEMVDLEHRRWVLEKVVDGWTAPIRNDKGQMPFIDCIRRGSVKDSVNRIHPCIVFGSATSPLSSPEYKADHRAKWDSGQIDPKLDELDRMSIELHRYMKLKADQIRKDILVQNPDLEAIRNLIPDGEQKAVKAYNQYCYVLKNIVNGVESYSRQYDAYQDAVEDSLKRIKSDDRREIIKRLKDIKHALFPVIESNLYRDYKVNDEILIRKIPYILTYTYQPVLTMAFEDGKYQNGRNEAVFGNVASATVLSPQTLRYLYCFDKESSAELFVRKLDAVMNYLGSRNVHSAVIIHIACLREVPESEWKKLQSKLDRLGEKYKEGKNQAWLKEYGIQEVENCEEAGEAFADYIKDYPTDLFDGSNTLFPQEYDNAMFISTLVREEVPYFEFNWRTKCFAKHIGCDYLNYIEDNSFIRIKDMFALMNAEGTTFHLPEFADDYETLWEICTGKAEDDKIFEKNVNNWNNLCGCLDEYESKRRPLASIKVMEDNAQEEKASNKSMTYYLPQYAMPTVKMLLQELKNYKVIYKSSAVMAYTTDTCKVKLNFRKEYESSLNDLFNCDHRVMIPYYRLHIERIRGVKNEMLYVRHEDLEVKDADLGNRADDFYKLLEKLETEHFIYKLEKNPQNSKKVSFLYSSPRIKHLLTSAGEILEIYAYYDILKTGYFDDVATGYEFSWESGGVKNELDLVLTKGFRSMIIECKSVRNLKLDYYHKLHSIADQFGIGTRKILLGNTYARSHAGVNEANTMQKSRGSQLSIQTISEKEEILHVGETLKNLMEK